MVGRDIVRERPAGVIMIVRIHFRVLIMCVRELPQYRLDTAFTIGVNGFLWEVLRFQQLFITWYQPIFYWPYLQNGQFPPNFIQAPPVVQSLLDRRERGY